MFFTPEPLIGPLLQLIIFLAAGISAFALSMTAIRAVVEGHWIDAAGIIIALGVTSVLFKHIGGNATWALSAIAATAACWWMGTKYLERGEE